MLLGEQIIVPHHLYQDINSQRAKEIKQHVYIIGNFLANDDEFELILYTRIRLKDVKEKLQE
jgi:hypothetical protein